MPTVTAVFLWLCLILHGVAAQLQSVFCQLVEVGCVEEMDRSQLHATETVKVWMGFGNSELIAVGAGGRGGCGVQPSLLGLHFRRLLPLRTRFGAAASEHFAFQSATGGEEPVESSALGLIGWNRGWDAWKPTWCEIWLRSWMLLQIRHKQRFLSRAL